MNESRILNVRISNVDVPELNKSILDIIKNDEKQLVLHVNIYAMNIAFSDKYFRKILNSSKITFCDGDGVRLGAKVLGKVIKEKITYNMAICLLFRAK